MALPDNYANEMPKTAAAMQKMDGMQKPLSEMGGEQPLSPEDRALRDEAYKYLRVFTDGCAEYHEAIRNRREVVRMRDPGQDARKKKAGEPQMLQLQTLKSTFNNCVADQLDNMPEANLLPERPGLETVAEDMNDVLRFILDQNRYEKLHRRRVEDYFLGTALTQIGWDEDMDNGRGNVALIRWPIEAFLWDPAADNIQDGRANIKVSWHPMSWFVAHYPDVAQYVGTENNQHNGVGLSEAIQSLSGDEGHAMLMEYWYRRYDAKTKRYTINVAYLAGGALLDHQKDVYKHGRYPFVMEAFDFIEGQPVGDGLVGQLTPMMRYVNRYAHYIDENLRMSAKNRLLVRKNAQLDMNALADFDQNIIEGQYIDEESVRWFQSKPLNSMAVQQMLQFQTDIKQDSGQSQWTRGETAGGVTAASAISALQEAGGKITREHTLMLNQGFKEITEQILWLVCQFYTDKKARMITGRDGKARTVDMSAAHLRGDDHPENMPSDDELAMLDRQMPGQELPDGSMTMGLGSRIRKTAMDKARRNSKNSFSPPPYTVQVQVSRRNPLRIQAQNELFIQAYTMAAQAGQQFPLKMLFELLVVDGKDRIMPVLEEVDQQTQIMNQLAQEVEMLRESNAAMKGTIAEYNQKLMGATPQAASAQAGPAMSAQAPGVDGNREALVGAQNKR